MHPEAYEFVQRAVNEHGPFDTVVEFGSIDINGAVRPLFGDADYTGVDLVEGPGVDVVTDVSTYTHPRKVDCVVCCEVLEHTPDGKKILANAASLLKAKGVLILTAATDPREPHSAVDGAQVREGEFYRNVKIPTLRRWLAPFSAIDIEVDETAGDVRVVAVK